MVIYETSKGINASGGFFVPSELLHWKEEYHYESIGIEVKQN